MLSMQGRKNFTLLIIARIKRASKLLASQRTLHPQQEATTQKKKKARDLPHPHPIFLSDQKTSHRRLARPFPD
jgi:hypothetical protein